MATQENAPTRFLTANNIKFAYRVIGEPTSDSTPVILLQHFRSNIDLWDPAVVNGLAAAGRAIVPYDYAGHGHSGGEVELTIKGFSANLIAFIRELLPTLPGSPTQTDLLGFSMGGYVVQQTVLDAPELIRKIVISGSGHSGSLGSAVRPMAEVNSTIMAEPVGGAGVLDAFFPSFLEESKAAGGAWFGRITSARANIAGKDGEPPFKLFLDGPGVQRLTEAYLRWDADPLPYALLQTVQKDALVTAGSNDLIVPTQNSFILAHQLPKANFIMYPTSGHGHLFQYNEVYVKQVTEFLDGKLANGASFGAIRAQLSA